MANDDENLGDLPTTGAMRPGPVGLVPPAIESGPRIRPVAIRIPSIGVDTEIEGRAVVGGVMQDPTGPWVISWYPMYASLDGAGNTVVAGHVDFAGVGPAVLWRSNELVPGDRIDITGSDVQLYRFNVTSNALVDAANPPFAEIVGPTDEPSLTIVTCGGTFDPATQSYLERRIIRAVREP